jgi:hypothetical protein
VSQSIPAGFVPVFSFMEICARMGVASKGCAVLHKGRRQKNERPCSNV